MKITMIAFLLVGSISTFAQASGNACSVICSSEAKPSVGAVISQVSGDFVFTNSRGYGTWAKNCVVLNKDQTIVFENTISGAHVTQIAEQRQGGDNNRYPGKRLETLCSKKEKNQAEEISSALEACNESL